MEIPLLPLLNIPLLLLLLNLLLLLHLSRLLLLLLEQLPLLPLLVSIISLRVVIRAIKCRREIPRRSRLLRSQRRCHNAGIIISAIRLIRLLRRHIRTAS